MKRVASLVALGTLLLLSSCNNKHEEKQEDSVYPVTTPVKMDTIINKDFVAQIQSVKNIEVRAQEKGFLEKNICRRRSVCETGANFVQNNASVVSG